MLQNVIADLARSPSKWKVDDKSIKTTITNGNYSHTVEIQCDDCQHKDPRRVVFNLYDQRGSSRHSFKLGFFQRSVAQEALSLWHNAQLEDALKLLGTREEG